MQSPAGLGLKIMKIVNILAKEHVHELTSDRGNTYVINLDKVKTLINQEIGRKLNLELLKDVIAKTAYLIGARYVIVPEHDKLTVKYNGRIYLVKDIKSIKLINLLLTFSTFVTYRVITKKGQVITKNGSVTLTKHYLDPGMIIEVIYGKEIATALNSIKDSSTRRKVYEILVIHHKELTQLAKELKCTNDIKLAKQFIKGIVKVIKPTHEMLINNNGIIEEIVNKVASVVKKLLEQV